ncbi:MAG: hypothetical protein H6605_04400 [Flavobacteriales bacterium]|nr:hypothetical protein [Flavobacteriales bacterium]
MKFIIALWVFAAFFNPVCIKAQSNRESKRLIERIDSLNGIINLEIQALIKKNNEINKGEVLNELQSQMTDLQLHYLDLTDRMRTLSSKMLRLNSLMDQRLKNNMDPESPANPASGDEKSGLETRIDSNQTKTFYDSAFHKHGTLSFREFGIQFIHDILKEGELGVMKYVDNKEPLYYLTDDQTSLSYMELKDIRALYNEPIWSSSLAKLRRSTFSFVEGTKPEVNCEMPGMYNKLGIYGGASEGFNKISAYNSELIETDSTSSFNKKQLLHAIRKEELLVKHFIFCTDGNLGFYFKTVDGGWSLYCISIEVPCNM